MNFSNVMNGALNIDDLQDLKTVASDFWSYARQNPVRAAAFGVGAYFAASFMLKHKAFRSVAKMAIPVALPMVSRYFNDQSGRASAVH